MLLHRLLDGLPVIRVAGPTDLEIRELAFDSRQVTPGSLFVAVPSVSGGERRHGSRYLADAVRRGAVALVVQEEPDREDVTTIQVPDTRAALADLAAQFFDHPSRGLRLFAVTGTDGKTTTTYLLEQILASAGIRTGLAGTVEIKIGNRREANLERMTTPESLDVQRLLNHMVEQAVTHAVVEASSHALALQRLRGCSFAACGLTNITADHLEFHGSWEAYFAAKATLFTELGRGCPSVLNRDDEHFGRLSKLIQGPLLTYGTSGEADISALILDVEEQGTRCMFHAGGTRAEATVPLPGRFNVSNALAAVGLALAAGLSLDTIAAGLSAARPPPGRLERIAAGQPFEVLVDYAHTVHAFRSVLRTLRCRAPASSRLIAVFGAAGGRDRAKRPVLARIAREHADFFIITNEDPCTEQPEAIMEEIAAGIPGEEEGTRYECVLDRARAIRRALERARTGDTVVILGKGHEQSIMMNGHKEPWSDVAVARKALEEVW